MAKNDLTKMKQETRLLTIALSTYWISLVALTFFEWTSFSIIVSLLNVGCIVFCLAKCQGQHTIKLIFSLIFALFLLLLQLLLLLVQVL